MKIKVIELLNMIAKGEEVPERIKDGSFELTLVKTNKGKHYGGQTTSLLNDVFGMERLNDEIEIIEDKPKEIEIIHWNEKSQYNGYTLGKLDEMLMSRTEQLKKGLNELINKVNEMSKDD